MTRPPTPREKPNEPALEVVSRKRGRPAVGEQVKITLPPAYVDKLFSLAHDHGLSMSAVGRQIVILGFKRL
jgi:hypothetical protein